MGKRSPDFGNWCKSPARVRGAAELKGPFRTGGAACPGPPAVFRIHYSCLRARAKPRAGGKVISKVAV